MLSEMDNQATLGGVSNKIERFMKEVRKKRKGFATMFENFDQKANQLFNILSSVLKAMKEMNSATTRNML